MASGASGPASARPPHAASHRTPRQHETRWPALAAVLAVGTLHLALPEPLSLGPSWLLLALVGGLLVPTVVAHRAGRHDVNAWLGHLVGVVMTLALAFSLGRLLVALPAHSAPPRVLLRAAAALWVTNVLVFASWYWRLDAGGPNARDRRRRAGSLHDSGAFLFPQMVLAPGMPGADPHWSPEFVDYLFLSFCTSTAFSPTDTPVLSRWAKLLVVTQATISLVIVGVLAARAVNIL